MPCPNLFHRSPVVYPHRLSITFTLWNFPSFPIWAQARVPWQGTAPTPLLPAPARSGNLPGDSNSWLVRQMHAWVPGGWESHSQHLKGWSTMCLPFTLIQTCLQRGPLLQRRWSGSWPLSKGISCCPLKMLLVPPPQSAPTRPLLRNFPLIHGEVLIYGCRVRTVHVYVFVKFLYSLNHLKEVRNL